MSDDLIDRIRDEFDRMRGEVHAPRPVPRALLARARRAMVAIAAVVLVAVAAMAAGSLLLVRAVASSHPVAPAASPLTAAPSVRPTVSPVATPPGVSAALLAHPLTLPTVRSVAACPVTPTTTVRVSAGIGFSGSASASVQRGGHAYLFETGAAIKLSPSGERDGWFSIKDIWLVDGSYRGPVLVRGARVDGAGQLELAWNPTTPREAVLQIDEGSESLQSDPATGWRSVPMVAYVQSPGCYAYQLDGFGFTGTIVFRVVR